MFEPGLGVGDLRIEEDFARVFLVAGRLDGTTACLHDVAMCHCPCQKHVGATLPKEVLNPRTKIPPCQCNMNVLIDSLFFEFLFGCLMQVALKSDRLIPPGTTLKAV